jgi:HEAT repeat protein
MCDGRHEVEDIGVPDGVAVPMVRLVSAPVGGLEWTFDRDSLRPWNAMTVRHEGTYLTNLIDVLGAFRNKSSIDVLSYTSAHHPDHFVRWCAVKNIGRIDRQAALAALHARLDDRHPEVRRAAERTLARHTAAATV